MQGEGDAELPVAFFVAVKGFFLPYQIRKLFLAGGVSFNNAKESKEASRRVELRMQFFGLKDKRDKADEVDFPPVVNKEVCQLVMPL